LFFFGWRFSVILLAGYNHYEIAQFLLENGSDPNAVDKGGLRGNFNI